MKIKKQKALIISLSLISSSLFSATSFGQDSIELGELIYSTSEKYRTGSLFVGWRYKATANSPIKWTNSGVGIRSGKVITSIDGLIADELRETIVPSPWDISLFGPKSGPIRLTLYTDGCYDFDSDGICDDPLNKMVNSIEKFNPEMVEICRFGSGSEFSRVFEINAQESIYTSITRHSGSRGYSYSITVIPSLKSNSDEDRLEEKSNICGAFFNHQYGEYGIKYMDYKSMLEYQ